jgi:hypothetical protein
MLNSAQGGKKYKGVFAFGISKKIKMDIIYIAIISACVIIFTNAKPISKIIVKFIMNL